MSVHSLASQRSDTGASVLHHSAVAFASNLLQIHSGQRDRVDPDHAQEWRDSGVDPGIMALNVETLTDTAIDSYAESLFPIAERLHWNLTRFGQKTRANLRGWWVSGIDPLNHWQRMTWGRFKPDAATPILDREKGKPAKYLSPSLGAGSSRLVLLDVPQHIWEQVAQRAGIAIARADQPLGFWHWVWKANVPIILTEGEKKAGCLLTQGYAAIALPGIFNGYRKDTRQLIPELAHFATTGRSVSICFDYETKPKTIQAINLATTKLGKLLSGAGCVVNVVSLPGPQKGVDDFIVAQGQPPFEALYTAALALEFWLATKLWALTYTPSLTLNAPYLGDVPYPTSGLVCIKSAKGTGKTTALQALIREATSIGRKVLVITHRIQLGRAICDSIGIDWIEDVKESDTQGLLGYGLCIDSLHATSQAHFNPQSWRGAIVILDEVEQVLWHALNSTTCYDHRVKILETLRELVQVAISSGGLIIAQDADLSDVSLDYLKGLVDEPLEPWLVVNQWKPETGWAVSFYDTKNSAPLVARMDDVLQQGAIFVALDSQKVSGRWSSKNLETYLQTRYPDKRILRIDSESVADPQHPAYGIVTRLNQALTHYDIVLATPTIGTGVSIDVRGHFKAVFGIFQGVTPDAESRQALARVREPLPRFVWAARFGPGKVGNGSCSYQDVIHSTTKAVKYNIALLKEVDFDLDAQTDPITLRSWAKMAARVNVSLWSYRNECRNGLVMEGHQVTTVTDDLLKLLPTEFQSLCAELSQLFGAAAIAQTLQADLLKGVLQFPGVEYLQWQHDESIAERVTQDIKTVQESSRLHEAQAIATAPDLTPSAYDSLKDQRAKTADERYAQHKHELQRRYPIPVTPELKIKDDAGWYAQLRLHYYLTHDPAFVRLRDLREWEGHLDRGDGKIALQDVRLLTAQVETFKVLGLLDLLDSDRLRANDAAVEQLSHQANQYRHDIKAVLNLTISEKMTPIAIVQALLGKLGLKLTCIGRDVADDGRRGGLRIYQYQTPDDDRDTIFVQWQQRDAIAQAKRVAEENAVASVQGSTAGIDPPPDIYVLKQSAGGITQLADLRRVEVRRSRRSGEQVLKVNLWDFLQTGDARQDITLRAGDSIFVPTLSKTNLAESIQLASTSFSADKSQTLNVAVVGEVYRPGPHTVTASARTGAAGETGQSIGSGGVETPPTITSAIQIAGGIKPQADIRQIQVRRLTKSGAEQTITIDLWKLLKEGDVRQDLFLQDRDTIVIPTAATVSPTESIQIAAASFSPDSIRVNIVGEVKQPGAVKIPPNTPLNQAVLAAGGFTTRARIKSVDLIRLNPNGTITKRNIDINFDNQLNDKTNPALYNDDIIIVNRSGLSTFSDNLSAALNPVNNFLSLFSIYRLITGK